MGAGLPGSTDVVCQDDGICDFFPNPGAAATPPASFADLVGETASGTWTLCVGDSAGGDTGTLEGWSLHLDHTGGGGGGGELLTVDLSVPNQVTITATSGVSEADASGSTTTGFLFENFFSNAGTQGVGTPTIVGTATLTAASVPADGSPSLFRGSDTDAGLNIWSYSATGTTTFTTGQVAFSGSATWSISPALYAAMLTAPTSGNLYFPADTSDDIAGAVLLGTYAVTTGGSGGDPAIAVNPGSLDFDVDAGDSSSSTLTIANTGGGVLDFTITESETASPPSSYKTARAARASMDSFPSMATLNWNENPNAPLQGTPVVLGTDILSQMADNTPAALGGISCGTTGVDTAANSWWRRFYLSEHGSPASIDIESVTVASESGPNIPATINLYSIPHSTPVDTIPTASLTLIGSGTGTVGGDLTTSTIPVTATLADAVGTDLVVEYHIDGAASPFFPGGNASAETHTSFISAADCGIIEPTPLADVGFPDAHEIIVVNLGDGGPPPPGCSSPVDVPWLSVSPANGSVAGGSSTDTTVTVDASGLVAGDYTANVCVASNDPVTPIVTVPISVTVTTPVGEFCGGGADTVFCDGFDGTSGGGGDIVTGEINLPVGNDFDGSALDLVTGTYLPYDPGRIDDINLYNGGDGLYVYWYADAIPEQGGVSTDGFTFDVLQSGDVIGPSSPILGSSIALSANWWPGADGYFGIAFMNEATGMVNYGYIHVTTSSPDGYPAQTLEYAYNSAGDPITIP
jgi:hypothetical protein